MPVKSTTKSKNDEINEYESQLTSCFAELEKINGEACRIMNEMLCDDDMNDLREDVQYTLNSNFCNGEHLLCGLLDVIKEHKRN